MESGFALLDQKIDSVKTQLELKIDAQEFRMTVKLGSMMRRRIWSPRRAARLDLNGSGSGWSDSSAIRIGCSIYAHAAAHIPSGDSGGGRSGRRGTHALHG